jgi:Leucine-rich repeat (LRR) protein
MERLDLSEQNLNELPENLPPNLKILKVSRNHLTQLPENLPPNLEQLSVSGNQLTQLPENLPPNLKFLYAVDNQLTYLPIKLPVNLKFLLLNNNQLTEIDKGQFQLLQHLKHLELNFNNIKEILYLPPSLQFLRIVGNPELEYICPTNALIEGLGQQTDNNNSTPNLTQNDDGSYGYEFRYPVLKGGKKKHTKTKRKIYRIKHKNLRRKTQRRKHRKSFKKT